jgi:putative heme transporter
MNGTPARARLWRRVALAVVLLAGYVGVIALTGGSVLSKTGSVLGHLRWKPVLPALFVEFTSMAAFARAQRRLLRGGGLDLQITSVLAVTYAGNAISVSLPVAGAGAGAAYTFRQFRRRGANAATATWAIAVSGLVSSFTFALVVAGGAVASGNETAAALGLAGATLVLVPFAGLLLALRYQALRDVVDRMATRALGWLNRARRRPPVAPTTSVGSYLDQVASIKLPALDLAVVTLLLLWNWVADCLCLAFSVRATGSDIPWHDLFLAYGAIGAGAFSLTPGGLGVVEIALSAALVAAGLPGPHALAAVLVYRFISFWLVMVAGWVLVAVLGRTGNSARASRTGTEAGP